MSDLLHISQDFLPFFNWGIAILAVLFAYNGASIYAWILLGLVFVLQFDPQLTFILWYVAIPLVFAFPTIRRIVLTGPILFIIKKAGLLPKISETEKTVLKSGNVWVDGELFSGTPNFKKIFAEQYPVLSTEEQEFLNNQTEELCKMCNDPEVYKDKDLSPKIWKYIKDKKFFGMIIPKKYGGLEFSAFGHSAVIQKLASRSVPLAITVMVPNSLGPAELLLHYGTKKQQDYYLPRLASGKEIPCFALTEPLAGSDATAISSEGILFKDKNGEVKIKLNWNKRYITLGAVATIIGLAFQLRDPENIMGHGKDLGITCALIPHKTKGVKLGRRHDPLATPFINSPVNGENVIIDIDAVIGGLKGLGKGWKMLMESLAAGRGISLPATSTGGAKLVTRTITAYANIRQQFGLSIGKFEGVSEVLARIVGKTYLLEAMRCFTAGAIDSGLKPAVITAIAKYHSTELFRQVINDGMDIAGGSGIIRGPRNLLANAYMSVPISITVEGANIITRSLIHFGQGVVMCHPFIYKEMMALEKGDIRAFDRAFFTHIGHMIKNKVRAIILGLTRGLAFIPSHGGIIGKYERKLAWASANFAFLADLAVLLYGGNLKKKEKINGRFGDILSAMYMAVCVLKRFDTEGRKKEDRLIVKYIMEDLLIKMRKAFEGISQNMFENCLIKFITFPFMNLFFHFYAFSRPINDKLEAKMVKQALEPGRFRDNLTKGIYIPEDSNQALGRLENAFDLFEQATPAINKIKKAISKKKLPKARPETLVDQALEQEIIKQGESESIKTAYAAIYDAIQVDEYSLSEYKKL